MSQKKTVLATGDGLEEVIGALEGFGPLAKETLISICNRADKHGRQECPRRGSELRKGLLEEAVVKFGTRNLAHLLHRSVVVTPTTITFHPFDESLVEHEEVAAA